jgi:hypothetical protein
VGKKYPSLHWKQLATQTYLSSRLSDSNKRTTFKDGRGFEYSEYQKTFKYITDTDNHNKLMVT